MRLPADSIIAIEKLTKYLLVFQEHSDKSEFLKLGGYQPENWRELLGDIRGQLKNEAVYSKTDLFGDYFEIEGELRGPLFVKTIWLWEAGADLPKFITLVPLPLKKKKP